MASTLTPGKAPIDPRIRQRRVEVLRREGRRRLRVLVVATFATTLTGVGWLITRSPLLDIDRIEVYGVSGSSAAYVLQAAGIHRHRPMVDLHAGSAASHAERLPWVAQVEVTREWPATVRVRVVKREPVAVVASGSSGLALVDNTGQVVAVATQAPAGTVRLEGVATPGPPGSRLPAAASLAVRVASIMEDRLGSRVEAIVADGAGTVDLRLRPAGDLPGARVRMGGADRVVEKLMAVQAVLDGVDVRTMATLDVRLPDNPVVIRYPGH